MSTPTPSDERPTEHVEQQAPESGQGVPPWFFLGPLMFADRLRLKSHPTTPEAQVEFDAAKARLLLTGEAQIVAYRAAMDATTAKRKEREQHAAAEKKAAADLAVQQRAQQAAEASTTRTASQAAEANKAQAKVDEFAARKAKQSATPTADSLILVKSYKRTRDYTRDLPVMLLRGYTVMSVTEHHSGPTLGGLLLKGVLLARGSNEIIVTYKKQDVA